ncbi:CCD81 protein, partial [Aegotheles bennettii]|nr:CCD81 protein [Aegotheles bennettii]
QGVLLEGLGTFAVVKEQFHGKDEVYVVRRPIFQLDMEAIYLRGLSFPKVVIPDHISIKTLDYTWLRRATCIPQHVVEACVQETILLYSFQLMSGHHLPFTFKDMGILSCSSGGLCMQFYPDCVTGIEREAGWVALLHT